MIKKLFLLFILLSSFSSTYSFIVDPFFDGDDSCDIRYINDVTDLLPFMANVSIQDILKIVVDEEMNYDNPSEEYLNRYIFEVNIETEDITETLYIRFETELQTGIDALFGSYTSKFNSIKIFPATIRKDIENTWGTYEEDLFLQMMENTLRHEITHYLDHKIGLVNSSQTFNIDGVEGGDINNKQFFFDIYKYVRYNTSMFINLRETIDFVTLLNISSGWYSQDKWYTELVARNNAICMIQDNSTGFYKFRQNDSDLTYLFCDNFTPFQTDVDNFNNIIDDIYLQSLFEFYPQFTLISNNGDSEICAINDEVEGVFETMRTIISSATSTLILSTTLIIVVLIIGVLFIIVGVIRTLIIRKV